MVSCAEKLEMELGSGVADSVLHLPEATAFEAHEATFDASGPSYQQPSAFSLLSQVVHIITLV